MEPKILGVGPRTAAYLRIAYPKSRAKLIARDFRVSTGTAERWLKGEAPTVAHIEQMTTFFGEPYIRALFAEAFERHDARVKELETSILNAIVASGMDAAAAGVSYVRGLADQGVTALRELADQGSNLVGLSLNRLLLGSPDANRLLLITGLIETVPAILSPPDHKVVDGVNNPLDPHRSIKANSGMGTKVIPPGSGAGASHSQSAVPLSIATPGRGKPKTSNKV